MPLLSSPPLLSPGLMRPSYPFSAGWTQRSSEQLTLPGLGFEPRTSDLVADHIISNIRRCACIFLRFVAKEGICARDLKFQEGTRNQTSSVVIVGTHGAEDQGSNLGAWDVRTGNLLQTYRSGSAAPHSLCLLGNESLIAASHARPVIHVWNMLRQSQKHRKLICGKLVSCLAITPDGNYVAAGLEDKIHIWQVCTGDLCSILTHCSAEVKCLKFSHSGEFLVSGYKDGTVAAWELQDSLHQDVVRIADQSPVSTFTGHTGEINGLHITLSNKIVSCAADFTVKVWDLLSSEELKMFELGAPVCSVIVDQSEFTLYAGDYNGRIYCIDLFYQPGEKSVHIDIREESPGVASYLAHL
ncbi:WD repeat-containing protein 18-like [Plakobranchus ocellatus]|uniref:WD repeat-containing protein 18-like n=1 Tax=Plakobranchus ocellatus TaxID=259542 RepID=A0AAV4ABG4_9GAST|nr:WD repeat-containing protein 18-like [Plakobranchus ocellatus]